MDRDELVMRLARMEESLANIEKTLADNGQPGFITRTNTRIGELEEFNAKAKGAIGIFTTILMAVGGTLLNHIWKGKG